MATGTRTATPLLDEVDTGVDTGTKRSKEMVQKSKRHTNRGCDDSNLSRYSMRKLAVGRLLDVYPGKDGHVQVAKLQVGSGTLTRPVTKMCPLELEL